MIKSKTSTWFDTTVRYEKTMDDASQKTVTEKYIVEAFTPTEAESRITEQMTGYVGGSFAVKSCTQCAFAELYLDSKGERWYKSKVSLITLDEATGKEKRSTVTNLVQATDFEAALNNLKEAFAGGMQDWEVTSLVETKFLDVYQYDSREEE